MGKLDGHMVTLNDGSCGEIVGIGDDWLDLEIGFGATRRVAWTDLDPSSLVAVQAKTAS